MQKRRRRPGPVPQVHPSFPQGSPPYVLRRLKINRNTMFWNFNFSKFPNSGHLQCRDFKIRKPKHFKTSKSQNCKRSRFQDFNISNFKTSNCKWVHSFKNSNFGKVGRIRFEILYRWAQCLTRNALARDALKSATSCKCWGGWFRGISRKWSTCARWPWIDHLGRFGAQDQGVSSDQLVRGSSLYKAHSPTVVFLGSQ